MSTANNNIEGTNNVVANNQDGYNSEVTNEVVVLNGDTFYKKNIVVGQKYRYGNHYFTISRFETRGTHLYYIGTLDKKPFENDLHALKVACECTERRAMNRSANDTEHGKPIQVKRTTKESAQLIAAKYAKAIEAINKAVAKLSNSDKTADYIGYLIDSLQADCATQVEAINNAALAEHNQRIEQLCALDAQLAAVDKDLDAAYSKRDFLQLGKLGTLRAELEAEYLLLQQAEAAYNANLAPVGEIEETASESEAIEDTESEETK